MMPRVVSDIHRSLGGRESRRFSQTHCPLDAAPYLVAGHIFRLAVHDGPIDPVAIEEIALRLVGRITAGTTGRRDRRGRQRAATSRAHDELADAVMLLLAGRYAEPLTLDLIAADVHSSPFHLCRVFKTRVGRSVHRYLTQLRLRAALERVVQGERCLTRLATEVGFSSHSHLSHAFRREFGTTPSAVRAPLTAGAVRQMSKILTGPAAAVA
jgi:AraC-like DNA-binding protein